MVFVDGQILISISTVNTVNEIDLLGLVPDI